MPNELLLICNLFIIFSGVLLFYYFLGELGLIAWTVIATVSANIEVLILVDAFGMEQTLGNVLFASTFLVTDILSEKGQRNLAHLAVKTGIFTSIAFIIISRFWLLFHPSNSDWASPAISEIFSQTPRLMIAGLIVYAIVQYFDVWFYHVLWRWSTARTGDKKSHLWLRNNVATLTAQLLNTVLFTVFAFWGTYSNTTLMSIIIASYVIFIFTSLADTGFLYLARRITPRQHFLHKEP